MDGINRQIYFNLFNVKYRKCLEPTESCREHPIRAHSIQNARVLDLLCEKGHVIMPLLTHDSDGKPSIELKLIGRNQSSTFTGLCSKHDIEIFKPIEQTPLDQKNPEHLFLLAYRSVLKETHVCIQSAYRLQSAYRQRMDAGLSPKGIPDTAGIQATAWIRNSYDAYCYKRKFDEVYLTSNYGIIDHIIVNYDRTLPSFAVSSLFSLDDIDWPDDVARIALNIFPFDRDTTILFSFLAEETSYVRRYIQRILDASGFYQKYLISKMVLQHTQNFVLSPKFYDHMSDEQKQAIKDFFWETTLKNMHDYENKHLYLFWDTSNK